MRLTSGAPARPPAIGVIDTAQRPGRRRMGQVATRVPAEMRHAPRTVPLPPMGIAEMVYVVPAAAGNDALIVAVPLAALVVTRPVAHLMLLAAGGAGAADAVVALLVEAEGAAGAPAALVGATC